MSITETEALGPLQGDVIVRQALAAALNDLRQNPEELDYVWASLAQDPLTKDAPGYGLAAIDAAKQWFINNKVEVYDAMRVPDNERSIAFCTVSLLKDNEQNNTLGDAHWAVEMEEGKDPFLTLPFVVTSYNSATRLAVLPAHVWTQVPITDQVLLATDDGQLLGIESVDVANHGIILAIKPGVRPRLNSVRLRYPTLKHARRLNGAIFRAAFGIGVHAMNEPVYCLYLYALVSHILTRYRAEYFEERGLQCTSFDVGGLDEDQNFAAPQYGYTRIVQLSGWYHQVWRQAAKPPLLAINSILRVTDGGHAPIEIDLSDNDTLVWFGDLDPLAPIPRRTLPVRIYFGAAVDIATEADVLELLLSTTDTLPLDVAYNAGPDEYCWLAAGAGDLTFTVGGVAGGFSRVGVLTVLGRSVWLWRSAQPSLESFTATVTQ